MIKLNISLAQALQHKFLESHDQMYQIVTILMYLFISRIVVWWLVIDWILRQMRIKLRCKWNKYFFDGHTCSIRNDIFFVLSWRAWVTDIILHTNIQFVRKNTYIAMILINIGQHFSFTTYMDRNLRPVIINIMKSEVSLVVYCIFFEFGCLYHYMYSSESKVLTVIHFKK